jgi:predicted double-glycine peptidase
VLAKSRVVRTLAAWGLLLSACVVVGSTYGADEGAKRYPWLPADLSETVGPLAVTTPPPDLRVWQSGPYCGVNCAYALLALDGYRVTHREFVASHPVKDGRGLSMSDLQDILSEYGVRSEVREVSPEMLWELEPPFVVRLQSKGGYHYAVFVPQVPEEGSYWLLDGTELALMKVAKTELHRDFTGYVLIVNASRHVQFVNWAVRLLQIVVVGQLFFVLGVSFTIWRRSRRKNRPPDA